MSHPEPGDSTSFPTAITIPDDGDTSDAASVSVALEGLADRTANLDARLTPVEINIPLVNLKTYVNSAALDISVGTPNASQSMFSAGLTTQVGDTVIVDLAGAGSCFYTPGATNGLQLTAELWASENGGSFTKLATCNLGSSDPALAANDTNTVGAIALKGCITIATAGTLAVEVRIRFTMLAGGSVQSGDLGEILSYRASLHQYRSP